ncbi:MAG: capsular biosynthesis protein [Bacteroidia bacterium]|jgi:tyrosine-protein phosphatase YwqE|nr:capsular biosynthesis protein [Bacteroidia bacterium]
MNFFSRIFSKPDPVLAADLSVIGVDMHSHFIPGIDDGAKTMQDSLQLLRGMQEFGYRKVITTPHVMSDFFRNTPEIILGGLDNVRKAAAEEGLNIEIDAAAEYYDDFELDKKIDQEKLLTFGGNYLLFEVSYLNEPQNISSLIFRLITSGYKPVLAHPERYPFWYRRLEMFEEIREKGVLLQLNINSLTGHYSPEAKKVAEHLIDKNMVDFLGSDCHHAGHQQLMQRAIKTKALHKLLGSGTLRNSQL